MPKKAIDKLFSPRQVREQFLPGLSRSMVYQYIQDGTIAPVYRINSKWLIPLSSIENFIKCLIPHEIQRPRAAGRCVGRAR